MRTRLGLQGLLFCALACLVSLAVLVGLRLPPEQEVLTTGVLIVLLGMPHGALDAVFAQRIFAIARPMGWVVFAVLYVAVAAGVVGLWWLAPTPFLVGFLCLSAAHFANDLPASVSGLARGLYGGAVIVLPALGHGPELERLLGWVAGAPSAAEVVPVLRVMAVPWLLLVFLMLVRAARTRPRVAAEFGALAALSAIAPPLVAFACYFCAMHSPRHMLKTLESLPESARANTLRLVLWPTLATFVALGVLGWSFRAHPVTPLVMQLVFVSLAALTLPHMLVLAHDARLKKRGASGSA
jgi:beta-carotene 15,15'-dioxygenase